MVIPVLHWIGLGAEQRRRPSRTLSPYEDARPDGEVRPLTIADQLQLQIARATDIEAQIRTIDPFAADRLRKAIDICSGVHADLRRLVCSGPAGDATLDMLDTPPSPGDIEPTSRPLVLFGQGSYARPINPVGQRLDVKA